MIVILTWSLHVVHSVVFYQQKVRVDSCVQETRVMTKIQGFHLPKQGLRELVGNVSISSNKLHSCIFTNVPVELIKLQSNHLGGNRIVFQGAPQQVYR